MAVRKQYNLSECKEIHPGVFHWKLDKFILVKDGEHYLILKDRLDKMVEASHGHFDEIIRDFTPRKFKAKDPNAPKKVRKAKAQPDVELEDSISSTYGWINPDYLDSKDKHYDTKTGFRLRSSIEAELKAAAKGRGPRVTEELSDGTYVKDKGTNPPLESKPSKSDLKPSKRVVKKKPVVKKVVKKFIKKKAAKKITTAHFDQDILASPTKRRKSVKPAASPARYKK